MTMFKAEKEYLTVYRVILANSTELEVRINTDDRQWFDKFLRGELGDKKFVWAYSFKDNVKYRVMYDKIIMHRLASTEDPEIMEFWGFKSKTLGGNR